MARKTWASLVSAIVLAGTLLSGCATGTGGDGKSSGSGGAASGSGTNTAAEKGGKAASGPKELKLNFRAEPPVLDSSKSTAAAAFTIIGAVNEGLYRIDKDGKPQPALAKDMPKVSADGKTYTVTLRDNLTFADGSKLTTADFDYAFKRALDPATKAQYSFMLSYIKGANAILAAKTPEEVEAKKKELGVKIIDEKTLEITLDQPVPFFTDLMAFQTYYPLQKSFVEKLGDKFGMDADKILPNGPFKLESWDHGKQLVLVKNDKYWDKDNVKLDRAVFNIVKDQNTGMNLYETNEADVADISRDFVGIWKNKPDFQPKRELTTSYLMFGEKNVPAFKNAKIRMALALAIDNQGYVDTVLGNGSVAAEGLIPKGMMDGNGKEFRQTAGVTMPKYDPAKAKQLLADGLKEAGLTAMPQLKVIADDNEGGKKALEFILNQWKQNLGFDAVAEPVPHALRIERQSQHNFEVVVSLWNGDYNDPMTFLDMWITGGEFNEVDYSNAEYDKLVNGAKAELDTAKRTKMLVDAEKILMQEMPIAPNYFRTQAYLVKPYVKGLILPSMGGDFELKWATIEK
ncbi:peptide ABC transporter substrate-binding protein [Gordoniibacillus kamchatkensis]|uniref:Peptide ABC transporter substrate-binding protein n=1 Tax=Gordoniibacillus kamchatkensis TaxID=1590651 RepID=A0ABR5AF39_9BACL|nr:peptide ABC transporter substrate-binding protein [Paenibacillus sp. VKM B-2647]KIL39606.1 peptide ABC transporter substrate-binding protein [Paenibacillus sp. VKM B-2647]